MKRRCLRSSPSLLPQGLLRPSTHHLPIQASMPTTRTLGPLHFEDLEPKRFEDLVRQLAYEFKPWRRLEATGRSGSDDGFDARGYEMVPPVSGSSASEESSDDEASIIDGDDDRLWLIQCKREKSIGPKALLDYLDEISLGPGESLHGLVFTAACDFSKKARDGFATKCKELGLSEWHLWGKAELEDRLMRPENDHLLFAYFGISLTIRKRSQRTELRSRLAMKRKAHRMLDSRYGTHVLLRCPDASSYPYFDDLETHKRRPQWLVREYRGMNHEGLQFLVQRCFAYLADDGKSWDAAMLVNDAQGHAHSDPWLGSERLPEARGDIWKRWDEFPEKNRAWLEVIGLIPFADVLDIDDLGDDFVDAPHVYAPFRESMRGPFKHFYAKLEANVRRDEPIVWLPSMSDGRIAMFPEELRFDENVTPGDSDDGPRA